MHLAAHAGDQFRALVTQQDQVAEQPAHVGGAEDRGAEVADRRAIFPDQFPDQTAQDERSQRRAHLAADPLSSRSVRYEQEQSGGGVAQPGRGTDSMFAAGAVELRQAQ